MPRGYSNTILVTDLLRSDGPFTHIADTFVSAECAGCGSELTHDPRYGEWGSYCPTCWTQTKSA